MEQLGKLSAKPQVFFVKDMLKDSIPFFFDGDRRKWLRFWDAFRTEVHEVQGISNVTKFNFLKGQHSDKTKKRVVEFISDVNYEFLVQTLITTVTRQHSRMPTVLHSSLYLNDHSDSYFLS